MPKNKDAYSRYRIIDQFLRQNSFVKTSRLADVCSERLGIPVSIRSIQKDIKDLTEDSVLNINAPILYNHYKKAYYYPEDVDEIFPVIELEKEEINALIFYAKTISQYKEYPIFNKITNAVKKVIDSSNISPKVKEMFEKETLLETEKHTFIGGIERIPLILDAITRKKIIEIEYKKYNNLSKSHRIKPILLKEDKQLWYILGIDTENGRLITLALDRIVHINISNDNFETVPFNSSEYFKFSFGITVLTDEPLDVTISFKPEQGNYLRTLPIHSTQKILEDTDEKFTILIKVKPSYEFYSKIFSYGSDATILSPTSVKEKVLSNLEEAISKYKTH